MKRLAFLFSICLLAVAPLCANSSLRVDFGQLSTLSDRVIAGRITKITAEQDARNGYIYSTVTVAVSQAVPEQLAGREYSFRMIGGELSDRAQYIADFPKFRVGNDVVLFLNANTSSVFGPTVGLGQGVFYLESSSFDSVQRVMDRYGRPVLGIREQRLIRGVRRVNDSTAGAARSTGEKGPSAMPVGDFFQQVRSLRASSPAQGALGR
jgi:hypothetical protein